MEAATSIVEPTAEKKKRKRKRPAKSRAVKEQDGSPLVAEPSSSSQSPPETVEETPVAEADGKRKRKRKRKRKAPQSTDEGKESTSNSVASASKEDKVEGTVYTEGIPYDADEKDVKAFFEQVPDAEVVEVRMPRYQDSGKIRGYAHVVFKDVTHVQQAITQLNGMRLMGRYLKVANARPVADGSVGNGRSADRSNALAPSEPPPPSCRTVFVKNLPYDSTEDGLRRVVEEVIASTAAAGTRNLAGRKGGSGNSGAVLDIRLAVDQGRLKGFGYVELNGHEGVVACANAARQGRLVLGGRRLILDYEAVARPKGSFRRTDGRLWSEAERR